MEMAALGEAGLFAAMQSGADKAAAEEDGQVMVAEEGYLAFLRNLKMSESDEMLQKVFAKVGTAGKLSEAQFPFLLSVFYRVVASTTLTDALCIKTSKRLASLQVGQSIKALAPMELDVESSTWRLKVDVNGEEGFVTVRGNQGKEFLTRESFLYKVLKDTVFTDRFEMKDFKVIRRLKSGEYLRAVSVAQEDTRSALWRLQARVLRLEGTAPPAATSENAIGWVTLRGNQGTPFLESISGQGLEFAEDTPLPVGAESSDKAAASGVEAEKPKVEEKKVEEKKVEEKKVEKPKVAEKKAEKPKVEEKKVEEKPKVEEKKVEEKKGETKTKDPGPPAEKKRKRAAPDAPAAPTTPAAPAPAEAANSAAKETPAVTPAPEEPAAEVKETKEKVVPTAEQKELKRKLREAKKRKLEEAQAREAAQAAAMETEGAARVAEDAASEEAAKRRRAE